jgi:hypothetical protein
MYTDINFKSKKALKEKVAQTLEPGYQGGGVTVYNPGLGGPPPKEGKVYLEGPHFPQPHKWYAEAWLENGRVIKIK